MGDHAICNILHCLLTQAKLVAMLLWFPFLALYSSLFDWFHFRVATIPCVSTAIKRFVAVVDDKTSSIDNHKGWLLHGDGEEHCLLFSVPRL